MKPGLYWGEWAGEDSAFNCSSVTCSPTCLVVWTSIHSSSGSEMCIRDRVMTAVIFLALLLVFLMAKPIGAYQMGEVYARNMGVNILRFRVALILLSSILSACVTAFAGPISFVGIAVPHLVKSLFKTAKPILMIPGCFLGGAVFCLFCDLAARTVFAPTELSISSVTAVFGAPIVIYMMAVSYTHLTTAAAWMRLRVKGELRPNPLHAPLRA